MLSLLKTQSFLRVSLKLSRMACTMFAGRQLKNIVYELEKFAPLNTAEPWDNVGLLIEPYKVKIIKKIMLTNDLTEKVMKEAVDKNSDMIISYHPPIFAPLKRITQNSWKERIVSICLSESIALYSPHTAWDAAPNGVNDWLSSALPATDSKPIQPLQPLSTSSGGLGRIISLSEKLSLSQVIALVQEHIGLDVHVALAVNHNMDTIIKTAAFCAGSGASLLKGVSADVYITGEMSHHELLDANHQNVTVILCNHSNSERGFLKKFQNILKSTLEGDCEILVSEEDADPLNTYVKKSLK